MIKPVVHYPAPVLMKVCEPVVEFGEGLQAIANDLMATCIEYDGYGLAAPQIGVAQRIIFVRDLENDPILLVNPSWTPIPDTHEIEAEEGCLSMPGVRVNVTRYNQIEVQALNINREPLVFTCKGLQARIIQHECDHLEGVNIIDKLKGLKRTMAFNGYLKNKKQMERRFNAAVKNGGISMRSHV